MSWNTAPALEIEMMENVSKIHSIIPCDFIYCSLIFSNQQDGIRIGPDLQKGRCELIRTNGCDTNGPRKAVPNKNSVWMGNRIDPRE